MSGDAILLPEFIADVLFGPSSGPVAALVAGVLASAFVCTVMLIQAAIVIWAKRKVTAAFTDRIAINRHGPFGLLIIPADIVRLLSKELIIPVNADRPAFDLGPLLVTFSALLGFAVIPMGTVAGVSIMVADPETGVVFVFAAASLATLGLTMAGYASGNKFSMLGGLRAIAQNIAYEIPLVLTAASVVLLTGTLQVGELVAAQREPLVTVAGVTIPAWNAFVNPFAFALFLTANLAEVGRNPFDTPEAPTELVAGYQTEYGSVYFVLLYMGEFLHIFLGGAIVAVLFLGGPTGPFLPEPVWFLVKIWAVFLFTQWARSAVPRIRIDQLVQVGWKLLLVGAFANLLLTALLVPLVF